MRTRNLFVIPRGLSSKFLCFNFSFLAPQPLKGWSWKTNLLNFETFIIEISIPIKNMKSRTESFRVEEIKQEKSNKLLNFTFITATHQAGAHQGTFWYKFCNEFGNIPGCSLNKNDRIFWEHFSNMVWI